MQTRVGVGVGRIVLGLADAPLTAGLFRDLLATYRRRELGGETGVMFGVNAIVTAGAGAVLRVGDAVALELAL